MPSRSTPCATLIPSLVAALAGTAMAVPPLPFPAAFELSSLDGDNGFVIKGVDEHDGAGWSVSSAGDVNGDGYGDLIIGAYRADPNGQSVAGESYVVFGKATPFAASLDLSTLDGTNGFALRGIDSGDFSGSSVSSAGDVNGDGYGDLIIGAFGADPNGQSLAGESYIVYGRTTGFAASLDPSTLNGTNGFIINGSASLDQSGWSVSCAGDVNNDGIDDLIIGARFANVNGQFITGASYVIFGRAPGTVCVGDVNGDGDTNASDFTILAGNFGTPVPPDTLGDLNSDGVVDATDFTILAGDFGCGS